MFSWEAADKSSAQAFDDLIKLKEQLLYSLSSASAATRESDWLSDADISEVNNDADSDREDDNVNSIREKNDVIVKEHITKLLLILNDSFCCHVSQSLNNKNTADNILYFNSYV